MNWVKRIYTGIAAVTGLIALGAPQNANATLILQIDDAGFAGSADIIVIDNAGAGTVDALTGLVSTFGDVDPTTGVVQFGGGIDVFSVPAVVGTSKPLIGGADDNILNLFGLMISSGAGTLDIRLTDTGFSFLPGPATESSMTSSIGGSSMGTVEASQFVDGSNAAFGTGGETLAHSPLGLGSPQGVAGFSETLSQKIGRDALFSISEFVTVTHTAGGQFTSFDIESRVTNAPEPGTLAVLGIGLMGLGFMRRRRAMAA